MNCIINYNNFNTTATASGIGTIYIPMTTQYNQCGKSFYYNETSKEILCSYCGHRSTKHRFNHYPEDYCFQCRKEGINSKPIPPITINSNVPITITFPTTSNINYTITATTTAAMSASSSMPVYSYSPFIVY